MTARTRHRLYGLATTILLLALVSLSIACGGAQQPTTSTTIVLGSAGPMLEGEAQQVADNWEVLFNYGTAVIDKAGLLQNGAAHQAELQTMQDAYAPLETPIFKVTDVKIDGNNAQVTFDVYGGPASPAGNVLLLIGQTGAAVREDGTWKVSEQSLADALEALSTLGAAGAAAATT